MTASSATVEEVIRQVIRGERPWTDLRSLGMDLRPETGEARDLPPTDVKVDIHDLASGFVAQWHDPAALRAWAFTLQAVDADFEPVEGHPSGEAVLDALWKASFGEPLEAGQVEVITKLAAERRSPS
jgi:hypothetical protein